MAVELWWSIFPAMDGRHGMVYPYPDGAWTREHRDAFYRLKRPGRVEGLPAVDWELRRPGIDSDVIPAVKGFGVYSVRLRDAIVSVLGPGDEVQWFEVRVVDPRDGSVSGWWVFHPVVVMPMDAGGSTYGGLTGVVKAVLDLGGVGGRQVFKYPYGHPPVVSDAVRGAVVGAGCTGMEFAKVPARRGATDKPG